MSLKREIRSCRSSERVALNVIKAPEGSGAFSYVKPFICCAFISVPKLSLGIPKLSLGTMAAMTVKKEQLASRSLKFCPFCRIKRIKHQLVCVLVNHDDFVFFLELFFKRTDFFL